MNHRNRAIERETDGTCAWLLDDPRYREWLGQQRGLLWLKGCPGAGKSTLLKYALRNGNQGDKRVNPFVVSFFFHGRGTELEKDLTGFYRSTLHQLLYRFPNHSTHLPEAFKDQDRDKERQVHYTWDLAELREVTELTLLDILKESPIRVYVDALDECGRTAAGSLVKDFRRFVSKCERTLFGLSICFTCRHYPIISLDEGYTITVEQENYKDIQRHIRHEFDSRRLGNSESIKELQSTIQERSKGVFQWVTLIAPRMVDMWLDGESKDAILQALRDTPQELNGVYEDIFQKLEHPSQSLKLFQWIYFATRPLSLPELRCAMNVDSRPDYHSLEEWKGLESYIEDDELMTRKIRSLSGGLAEIVLLEEVGHFSVQTIHLSVNDCLFSRGFQQLDSTLCSPELIAGYSHTRLSRSCIAYIATHEVRELLPLSKGLNSCDELRYPFVTYAYDEYGHHARKAEKQGIGQEDLWDYLGMPSARNGRCSPQRFSYPLIQLLDDGPTILHLALKYMLDSVLCCLIQEEHRLKDIDLNGRDKFGWTSLLCAIKYGHEALVSSLLKQEDLKVNPANAYCQAPLFAALEKSCVTFVRLLLTRRDIDVNLSGSSWGSPLITAIVKQKEAAVQLLLAREDVNVNLQDSWGRTALLTSIIKANEATFRLVLAHKDIDVNLKNAEGRLALITAIDRCDWHIARLLLSREDIDINLRDADGRTALIAAVQGRNNPMRHLERKDLYMHPLDYSRYVDSVIRDSEATLQLLFAHEDIDINLKDAKGRTALIVAIDSHNEQIARLLLSREDVDLNLQDADGRTALIATVERSDCTILQVLLSRQDVDVNVQRRDGKTALTHAIIHGAVNIVRLLLEREEIDLSVRNEYGHIPIAAEASFEDNQTIIRLLEEQEETRATRDSGKR